MTVLDVLTIDIVSNAKQAKKDVAELDKQIAQLAAKGSERDKAENKQLAQLHKQRREATRDLNDMTRAIDAQGSSLGKILTAGASAFGAFTVFNGIKAGILNVTKYNAALSITSKVTDANIASLRALDAAMEAQGAGKGAFLQTYKAAFDARSILGQKVGTPEALLDQLRDLVKGQEAQKAHGMLGRLGIPVDEGMEAFLRTATDAQYDAAKQNGFKNARLDAAEAQKAQDFENAKAATQQALQTMYTQLAEVTLPALSASMQVLTDIINKITSTPGGSELATGALAIGGIYGAAKMAGIGKSFFTEGAAAAGGRILGLLGDLGLFGLVASSAYSGSAAGETIGRAINRYRGKGDANGILPGMPGYSGSKADTVRALLLKDKSITQDNASGIIANLIKESGLNPDKVGDNGKAYGIGQWHPDRQADFARIFGHDIHGSSLEEQVQFLLWELHNTRKKAGDALKGANAPQSGAAFSLYDESPRDKAGEAMRRAALAARLAQQQISAANASPYNAQAGVTNMNAAGDKTVHVKIDNVTVHTQATDAQTMAKAAAQHLSSQIQFALNQFDDGAFA